MVSIDLLLVLPALVAIGAGGALVRRERTVTTSATVVQDVVVDLEFLRSRPAGRDQPISELAAMSGRQTLGARMRSAQLAQERLAPSGTPVRCTRRRAHPLVAAR